MKSLTNGHLKSGLNAVRNAKLRSFWTMLGVIIGVTSVITVVGIGEGIKQQISGQIHHFGDNVITVRPAELQTTSDSGNTGLNILSGLNITAPLTAKDYTAVKHTAGVGAAAPLTIATGKVSAETGVYDGGFVIGTTGSLPGLLNQSLAYGTFIDDSEDTGTNVAILGQHAVDKMFDTDVPLGHSFTFHGQKFIVKGIFNRFATTPLSQQADFNNAIFIPNDVAESLTNNTAPTYAILARSADDQTTSKVADSINGSLNKSRGGGSANFEVLTGDQNLETSNSVLNLLTRMIAGIAAISLLVGGIGIMNVMLVSVAERMHEIGIRKAIGATNRQILSQFVIESGMLTLIGGIIGIILSLLINLGLRLGTNLQPVITWQIVAIATGVSLLTGVVFGTVPAVKAARKDPIEALRSD